MQADQIIMETENIRQDGMVRFCVSCGRPLVPDEIALTRKLINRGADCFWCLTCLSGHFELPEEILVKKIRQYREMGCTLFTGLPEAFLH